MTVEYDENGLPIDHDELHLAAQRGDVERLRELLAGGADINGFDFLSKTALTYAAEANNLEVVRFLLSNGADVNAHEEQKIGNTVLREVVGGCSVELAQLLLDAGADPTIPGWMGLTALDCAGNRQGPNGPRLFALLSSSLNGPPGPQQRRKGRAREKGRR